MGNNSSISNSNRYYLIRAFFFVLAFFVLDRGLGLTLTKLYENSDAGNKGKIRYALSHSAQLVIFGSSRSASHYIPQKMESILFMNTVNAGIHGSKMALHYGIEQLIFEQYHPKIIVLDLYPSDFTKKKADNLYILRPYYSKNRDVKAILDNSYPFESIKSQSAIYPFNSDILTFLNQNLRMVDFKQSQKGFDPLLGVMKVSQMVDALDNDDVKKIRVNDSLQFKYLEQFIVSAKQADAKIILVISPIYRNSLPSDFFDEITQIADGQGVPLLNFSKYLQDSPEFFNDPIHLNISGAELFTDTLSKQIKQVVLN